jgi:hypothetical protein
MSVCTVVPATFNDELSADTAAASPKQSGIATGDAVGVLVLDEQGQLKADRSPRAAGARVPASVPS